MDNSKDMYNNCSYSIIISKVYLDKSVQSKYMLLETIMWSASAVYKKFTNFYTSSAQTLCTELWTWGEQAQKLLETDIVCAVLLTEQKL